MSSEKSLSQNSLRTNLEVHNLAGIHRWFCSIFRSPWRDGGTMAIALLLHAPDWQAELSLKLVNTIGIVTINEAGSVSVQIIW